MTAMDTPGRESSAWKAWCVLASMAYVCAAGAAPPPPTSAELASLLGTCPEFKDDAWPVVDQLHDQLIADWRSLPATQTALEQQRGLESRFADDVGAAVGASPECVATLKLALEEVWLRRRLQELQVKTSVPATDDVILVQALRRRPEVASARAAAIRALRVLVADAERHVARGEAPRSTSVFRQLRFDSENARERARRSAAPTARPGAPEVP